VSSRENAWNTMAGVASKAAAAKPPQLSFGAKLWVAYLIALQTRPIFTKSATQLVLSGGQELTAQALVGTGRLAGRVLTGNHRR